MLLDLKGYFDEVALAKSRDFSFEFSMADVLIDGSYPFVSPVKASGTVKSENGAVRFTAKVSYTFSLACDRCLETITENKESDFSHLLILSSEETEDDTYFRVTSEEINAAELLREDIILSLPYVYLCSPDCKGLCPKCGKNLNLGPCGCKEEKGDPRLSVLKTLLDKK